MPTKAYAATTNTRHKLLCKSHELSLANARVCQRWQSSRHKKKLEGQHARGVQAVTVASGHLFTASLDCVSVWSVASLNSSTAAGVAISAMRMIPQQMASLKAGNWMMGVGKSVGGRTLGIYGYGRIGAAVAALERIGIDETARGALLAARWDPDPAVAERARAAVSFH